MKTRRTDQCSSLDHSGRFVSRVFASCLALAAAMPLASCGSDDTDTRADSILNGTAVSSTYQNMVQVRAAGNCTGVLLRNDWVLTGATAACNSMANILNPSTMSVTYGSQTATVDAALRYEYIYNRTMLLHLATPLMIDGSTAGYRRDLYAGSVAGRSLECLGFGNSTTTGGAGTLRRGYFVPTGSVDYSFTIGVNSFGQLPWAGDEGSACLVDGAVAGVASNLGDPSYASYYGGTQFRQWTIAMMDRNGPPVNDARANAVPIGVLGDASERPGPERTVWGTTIGATHDGPTSLCGCTSGADIWYAFTVGNPQINYFDTAGSDFDTSIVVTDASGTPISGACNDDAYCLSGGFTSAYQSRVAVVLQPGRYYVAVGGCSTGHVVLHRQMQVVSGGWGDDPGATASYVSAPLAGDSTWASATPGGTGRGTSTNCSAPGAEVLRWFTTCGDQPQLFSLCQSDGGRFTRRASGVNFDPVLRLRAGLTNSEVLCNDDGGAGCAGVGGDAMLYGSRLSGVVAPRGLGLLYVDERTAGSYSFLGVTNGMNFTLRYTVR